MDLIDDPIHDPLEELPREVEGLGRHVVRCCHGTEDNDLVGVSIHETNRETEGRIRSRKLACLP